MSSNPLLVSYYNGRVSDPSTVQNGDMDLLETDPNVLHGRLELFVA